MARSLETLAKQYNAHAKANAAGGRGPGGPGRGPGRGMATGKPKDAKGTILLTADHGNADKMAEETGEIFTAHTTNPVPLLLINEYGSLKDGGVLADLAPTMLDLMGLPQPEEMTGKSLLVR